MTDEHIKSIIMSLHPLERKVLPHVEKHQDFIDLVNKSDLSEVEVLRALQWLQNKGLVKIKENLKEVIILDKNGEEYKKQGLPENRVLRSLTDEPIPVSKLISDGLIKKEEENITIGMLKKKLAIDIIKEGELKIKITDHGKKLIQKESFEEKFLKKEFPTQVSSLQPEEKFAFEELKKRKEILKVDVIKEISATLEELGKRVIASHIKADDVLDSLTPDLLKSGEWKKKIFRSYDISGGVPRIYGGRRHPMKILMEKMRRIWLDMGFQEMTGPWVESAFWCMDSMWIPQDHPAREMQDTFYLPYSGDLPKDITQKVADEHEHGGKCGSKGYGYKWNPEIAKALVLRTHTTAATFRLFGEKKIQPPSKYFSIGRIFRNEALDATHLPEFHQIEGFVMDEDLTLRDLQGYIKEFYNKMGVYKIKFKPVYNPYTEPSMEAMAYNEQLGRWVELINSGVFRPESLEPYGINVPVIAWGLGFERLAMMLYQQDNIRNIVGSSCDLDWLRSYRMPL